MLIKSRLTSRTISERSRSFLLLLIIYLYMSSKSKALKKVSGKKPFYTRANGKPESKKEYYARHFKDLSDSENS